MTDAVAIVTDVVRGLGDMPNIPAAVAAFKSQNIETKIVESLIILDDVGKIVGLFFPPVAVVANDLGIAIEVEQILEPIVAPVIEKITAPLVEWIKSEINGPPKRMGAPHRATRPLLILTTA